MVIDLWFAYLLGVCDLLGYFVVVLLVIVCVVCFLVVVTLYYVLRLFFG